MSGPVVLAQEQKADASKTSNDNVTVYKIQNRWISSQYLYDAGNELKYGDGNTEDYLWILEDKDGFRMIKNKATGEYINIKNGEGKCECTAVDVSDKTAHWTLNTIDGTIKSIQNRSNDKFLNIEKKLGYATCDIDKEPTEKDWFSAQWNFIHAGGPVPPPEPVVKLPYMTFVDSPGYCSDIKGRTTIKFSAKGMTDAEASCWHQPTAEKPDVWGFESKFAENIKLDAEGTGTIEFPADDFPHGPVTIKIHTWNEKKKDNCYLQLYNKGGVLWNQGAPKDPPSPAEGMKLIYVDDFDKALSISKDGQGATYCSHKPGGGDFSSVPFTDFEAPNNPFSQVDSYMRIRCSKNTNSTGLISSLRMDGTGFTANVPCYFECRMIGPTAPGSWPAFWVMTRSVYKGLKEPADELDTIEAYGGEGPKSPKQTGYWIATHYWNQGEEGKKQKGIYQQIKMTEIGGKSSWFSTFHVYGTKITMTDTIYYCDNVEVGRHPTGKLSKTEPWFFFVNLATGGGWPVNLKRYNNTIDMYVDYVRVYQGDKE